MRCLIQLVLLQASVIMAKFAKQIFAIIFMMAVVFLFSLLMTLDLTFQHEKMLSIKSKRCKGLCSPQGLIQKQSMPKIDEKESSTLKKKSRRLNGTESIQTLPARTSSSKLTPVVQPKQLNVTETIKKSVPVMHEAEIVGGDSRALVEVDPAATVSAPRAPAEAVQVNAQASARVALAVRGGQLRPDAGASGSLAGIDCDVLTSAFSGIPRCRSLLRSRCFRALP